MGYMPKTKGTCHDDPWIKEDNNIEADNSFTRMEILYNHIFKDINSQEDRAKQLTSINALLIGGYLAILMNSQSLGIMRDVLVFMPFPKYLAYAPIIPIIFWFISLIFVLLVFNTKAEKLYLSIITEASLSDLIYILNKKRLLLNLGGYCLTIIGLFSILIIIILIIPSQLTGLSLTWNNDGIDLMDQGKFEEALAAFDKAIDLNPQYAEAWNNKGRVLATLSRLNEANEAFDKSIKINPNYAEAWYNKGRVLAELNKYGDSLIAFDNAIQINPTYSKAWNSKGVVLYVMQENNQSIAAFNRAIELNPGCAEALNNKGVIFFMDGKYDESRILFERAIQLEPNYYEAIQNRHTSDFIGNITALGSMYGITVRNRSFYTTLIIYFPSGNETEPESVIIYTYKKF